MSDSEKIASDMMLNEKIDALDKLTQVVSRGFASSTRYLLLVLLVASILSVTLLDDLKDENNKDKLIYKIEEVADVDKNLLVSDGQGFYEKELVVSTLEKQKKDVPFLGKVSEDQFYPVAIILLSLLMLLFGISHSHAIRSRKLIGFLLDKSDKLLLRHKGGGEYEKYNFHPVMVNDLIDSFVVPSINKTSPLVQLALDGESHFLHNAHEQRNFKKECFLYLDVIIKLFSLFVIYIFPMTIVSFGLYYWFCFGFLNYNFLSAFVFLLCSLVCCLPFLHMPWFCLMRLCILNMFMENYRHY